MKGVFRVGFLMIILGSLFLSHSCKKEEPIVKENVTYTIKGRITPVKGDTNVIWGDVPVSLYWIYEEYLSPNDVQGDTVLADSLGYFEINYSPDINRKIESLDLIVVSDSIVVPYHLYCPIVPSCSIGSTNFYRSRITVQGKCKGE
jgi:hypothetical protein